jgi:hypothetical protein
LWISETLITSLNLSVNLQTFPNRIHNKKKCFHAHVSEYTHLLNFERNFFTSKDFPGVDLVLKPLNDVIKNLVLKPLNAVIENLVLKPLNAVLENLVLKPLNAVIENLVLKCY